MLACCTASLAHAQLRLPPVNLPGTPNLGLPDLRQLRGRADGLLRTDDLDQDLNLAESRLASIKQMLRERRDVLEADPHGEPVVRHEILAWTPSKSALGAIRSAGFEIKRVQNFEGLDQSLIVIRVPDVQSIAAALDSLRALSPDTVFDFNHVYTQSAGAYYASAASNESAASPPIKPAAPSATRIGLVDGGLQAKHRVFKESTVHRHGCEDREVPSEHGIAVASLMVGGEKHFSGVLPGATLYAADIYCGSPSGGSLDRIADALAWLSGEKVAVINLSIVGPPNQALERMVRALLTKGHMLVAAVGNDGPAAPPLYPASYPGVVGVTAVDANLRPLPEAARGAQVMFAAPGSNMVAAAPGTPPYRVVRGTSFASPIVAAMAASYLPLPDPLAAKKAIAALISQAHTDHPKVSSQDVGFGVIGEAYRVDPDGFH
jgi:hypothetical protein